MTDAKRCTKCGETKPLEAFGKQQGCKDGKKTTCKVCHAAMSRAWQRANPEMVRERKRAYRKAHPEKDREKGRAYREANREKAREALRAWRLANPERVRELREAENARRRARRLAASKAPSRSVRAS